MSMKLVLLLIGIAAGYSLGFKDAQVHKEDVVTRAVDRLRERGDKYSNDIDGQLDKLEKR
jgi:hypothetical protein